MKVVLPCTPVTEAEFDLGALAEWLAFQTDETQATFFNEFDTQLRRACDVRNGSMGWTMQAAYIRKYLSSDTKNTLSEMATD